MVVALTMRDLADDEIAALAGLDVEAFLEGTVFAGVSGRAGVFQDGVRGPWGELLLRCSMTAGLLVPVRSA